MSDRPAFPEPAALVPHRGPALFLRELLEVEAETVSGRGRIPDESAYATDRSVPAYVALDLAAQAAAALELLDKPAGENGAPSPGFIVRIRSVRQSRERLPTGVDLRVRAERVGRTAGLHAYRATVEYEGAPVLRCEFSTFVEARARHTGP